VEFPGDGVKPPPKHPNSIRKAALPDPTLTKEEGGEFNTFVKVPSKNERPAGREKSKRVDAINLIVDKVTEKASSSQQDNVSLQNMWLKIESAIELTSKHMKANIENQIMANAPSPIRKSYFDNLYRSIAAEAETRAVESENRRKVVELEKRELELKQKSIQLREALRDADSEMKDGSREEETKDTEAETKDTEVECYSTPSRTSDVSHSFLDNTQSKWITLLGSGLVPTTHHLKNAEKGAEFACVHNRDSNDFMNEDKFERFILRKTKCSEPFEWDLLDETGTSIVQHIVEDDDQGPSKEWGPYGWYRYPTPRQVNIASQGKTVYLSPEVGV
jgi:hypothetical protein